MDFVLSVVVTIFTRHFNVPNHVISSSKLHDGRMVDFTRLWNYVSAVVNSCGRSAKIELRRDRPHRIRESQASSAKNIFHLCKMSPTVTFSLHPACLQPCLSSSLIRAGARSERIFVFADEWPSSSASWRLSTRIFPLDRLKHFSRFD